jgi:hypothetical protein
MSTTDHHGPKAGCTYYHCGVGLTVLCPFTKDDMPPAQPAVPDCKHEWRLLDQTAYDSPEFYCIHCLTMTIKQRPA